MPNNLTDAEIKKALECCIKSSHFGECFENECPLVSEKGCKVGRETLYPYALDLINRQEEEIKHLDIESDILKADVENLNRICDEVNAENESLKAEVEKLKTLNSILEAEVYRKALL